MQLMRSTVHGGRLGKVRYNMASARDRNLKLCTVALQLRAGMAQRSAYGASAKHVWMRKPCLIFSMRLQSSRA